MCRLSELIYLDRERCIQCARCVRFQDEVAGDSVLGFTERGRSMQIVSLSEPGFDSVFSGNTTDICPVGALTTADFRFGARPWELAARLRSVLNARWAAISLSIRAAKRWRMARPSSNASCLARMRKSMKYGFAIKAALPTIMRKAQSA
jgi:NADH dehydrogenase/NADH:ubiquinone oxidoreductase subunit G